MTIFPRSLWKTILRFSRTIAAGLLFASVLIHSASAQTAETAAPAIRIQSEISNSARSVVKGTRHPMAQARYESGRVAPATPIRGMSLTFRRSAAQQADLDALIAAQQNRNSPLYHKWLTPDEFAVRFGMAQADLARASQWLRQQGFTVDRISRGRDRIYFTGTAGQVETAFQTQMHYYTVDGQKSFAPSTELSLPSSLAAVVLNVRNVSSFHPPSSLAHPSRISVNSPDFTSGISGNIFVSPKDTAVIYDINPLYSSGLTGAGQSIAIVGESNIHLSDIEHFQTAVGWSQPKDPTMILVPDSGDGGAYVAQGEAEADLDLEWSSTTAPDANIFYVYVGDNPDYSFLDAIVFAVEDRVSPVVNVSFGFCEAYVGDPDNVSDLEAIWQQAAAQGQTLVAASGDSGASTCAREPDDFPGTFADLAVSYPASSPWFLSVGGTEFNEGSGTYWASTPGTDIVGSALSYIPERVWNDDVGGSQPEIAAGGGGASVLFSKPSWQTGVPGIPDDGARDIPDVALDAALEHDSLLVCSSDPSFLFQGEQTSCSNGFRDAATNDINSGGGTSFAAPIFTAMVALLNQKSSPTGAGVLNTTLYSIASNPSSYASGFHDITTGDNRCDTGENSLCPEGTIGYDAVAGYDLATGLGSVDMNNLAALFSATSLPQTTTTITPSTTSPEQGASVTFTIAVAAQSGNNTPTGTVNVLVDGVALSPDLTLTNGTASFSQQFSPGDDHIIVATYSGDSNFSPSTATVVEAIPVATQLAVTAASGRPQVGQSDIFYINVASSAETLVDGNVSVAIDGTTVAPSLALNGGSASYSTAFSTVGSHSVQVSYAGTNAFYPSTGSVTVNAVAAQVSTTTSIQPATTTPALGASDAFTITVTPASGTTAPTGSVSITVDGAAAPAVTLTNGTATFTTSFKNSGKHTVAAIYSGSSSFSPSNASTTVTTAAVAAVGTTTTVTPASATPSAGASDAFTITVAPASGTGAPTGSVAVTVDGTATPALALTDGTATFTTSFSTVGAHTVAVSYSGDNTYAGSSASTTVTVPPGSFTLSASALSMQSGSTGSSTITVTPANGYTGTIAFAVTSSPALSGVCVATIPNATVKDASAVTSTLTVNSGQSSCPAATAAVANAANHQDSTPAGHNRATEAAATMAGLLAVGLLGKKSKKLRMLCVALMLTTAGLIASGCGTSGNGGGKPPTSPAATTYTLTVTGTDTANPAITSSTTLTLTVN